MAVRKSTRDGLKNMANDDVIRQAQLKLEMMSNEQIGPLQMPTIMKQQYHISDMLCGPHTISGPLCVMLFNQQLYRTRFGIFAVRNTR